MFRQPKIVEKCTNELWEGVACDLPAGHKGPHHRAASSEGAALSWRSSGPARTVPGFASALGAVRS